MADLDFLQRSSPVQIVGGDELFPADVIEEFGLKKLRVKSDNEISSSLNIFASSTPLALVQNVETTLYTGMSGTLSGLVLRFSKDSVIVKVIIDSVILFEIDTETIKNLIDFANAAQPATYVSVNSNRRAFYFTPNFPVKAETSILITVTATLANTDLIGQVRQVS